MASKFLTNPEPEQPNFLSTLKLTSVTLAGGILCHICNSIYQTKKEYDVHYKQHDSNGIIYTCIVCRKQNNSYPTFRGHCYNMHVIKDRFQCKHCSKKISTKYALQEHVKAMHSFNCTIKGCKKQFPTQNELTIHKIIHKNAENKPPYQCQTCDKQITNIDECEHHIDKHCTYTFSCPVCNEEHNKSELVKHLKTHYEDSVSENVDNVEDKDEDDTSEMSSVAVTGGILCCHCENIFKNRELFDAHFSSKHADKNLVYSCIICQKQFEKYALFGGHCYDHVAKTKFECSECDKSFSRLCHLVMHTDVYHSQAAEAGGAPLKCKHCPRTFYGDKRYSHHLKTKHDSETIDCPEPGCNSTFHTKKELVLHAKLHKSLSSWCRQCGLQLPTLASCEKHLDVHRKTLFNCPVCNRNYREKSKLLTHSLQHFEAVIHICKTCGKVYNEKRRLVEHMKIHSTDKSYKCQYCTKSFTKTNHLKQHLSTHSGMKPYNCAVCSKTFASYPNWHKHLRKVHNLDKNSIKHTNAKKTPSPPMQIVISNVHSTREKIDYESDDSTMDSDNVETVDNMESVVEQDCDTFGVEMDICNSESVAEQKNILPEEIADFATESEGPIALPAPLVPLVPLVPREYGPDFVNTALEPAADTLGKFIDLDDHLPHIDPRLATTTRDVNNLISVTDDVTDLITNVTDDVTNFIRNTQPIQYEFEQNLTMDGAVWDPPVIKKVFGNLYDDIGDMSGNLLSVMKSDVF